MISDQLKAELKVGDISTQAVGHRLRLLRAALGLTQVKMSALMTASIKNYQHMERGDTYPRPCHVQSGFHNMRIDFNFVYAGDYTRLPFEIIAQLQATMANRATQ
jgi:transcriptional regulator with XRE-family HTH domain